MKKLYLVLLLVFSLIFSLGFVSANVFISEIMYHPTSNQGGSNNEWVEIYNNDSVSVNLSDWKIDGKDFDDASILPNEYIVLTKNKALFEGYYGNNDSVWNLSDGNYSVLNISGSVSFTDENDTINLTNGSYSELIFYDHSWGGDMNGKTIERYNFISNKWTDSLNINGTPGSKNSIYDDITPIVSFTINPSTGIEGQKILLNASSSSDMGSGILNYSWSFGDGDNGTGSFVNHTYSLNNTFNITLLVYDYANLYNSTSILLIVNDSKPKADFIVPVTITENQNVTFIDNSTSYDNIINWSWIFGDGNRSNFKNGTNSYVINGTYYVNLTVTDSDGSIDSIVKNVTVVYVNDAPIILGLNSISFNEDSYNITNLSLYVSDEENQDINWTYSGNTSNLSIYINNTNKLMNISAEKDFYGIKNITLTATDSSGASSFAYVIINITNQPDAPVLQNISNRTVVQDSKITINLLASDVDGDNLTFNKNNFNFGTINTTTGVFEWTPNSSFYGVYAINFSVSDSNLQDSKIAYVRVYSTLNITSVKMNSNQVQAGSIVNNVNPGNTVQIEATAKNIGSNVIDDVNISLSSGGLVNPQSVYTAGAWNSAAKTFTFNVSTLTQAGLYNVSIKAVGYDHDVNRVMRYDFFNFTLNVTQNLDDIIIESVNMPNNTIKCVGETNITVNITNKGLLNYSDVNVSVYSSNLGLNQSFSNIILPSGRYNDSLFFRINTTGKSANSYSISIVLAYYAGTKGETKTTTLNILNCEPRFINGPINDISLAEESYNDTVNLSRYFYDLNGDSLTYTASGNTSYFGFNYLSSGLVNITAQTQNFYGVVYLNFTANDNKGGLNTSNTIMVNVTNVNDIPTLTVSDKTFSEGQNGSISITASDVDGDSLTIGTNATNIIFSGMSFYQNGTYAMFNWTPQDNNVGVYSILFNVTDGINVTQRIITLTVTNQNNKPNLSSIGGPYLLNEGEVLSFNLSASDIDLDSGDNLSYSCNLSVLNVTRVNNTLARVMWTPTSSYVGNNSVSCKVTDSIGEIDTKNVTIEVLSFHVIYSPLDQYIIVQGNQNLALSYSLPSGVTTYSSTWKEWTNASLTNQQYNTSSYTFSGKSVTGDNYQVMVEIVDSNGNTYTHYWYPRVRTYPIVAPYTSTPDLSTLNTSQLQNVSLTVTSGGSKIEFSNPINLSNVFNIGSHVYIGNSIAAVNISSEYSVLSGPAKITITGLTYNQEPQIYHYDGGFTIDPNLITELCPSSICPIISRTNYPTTSGTVVFTVPHFSSYRVFTNTTTAQQNTTTPTVVNAVGTGALSIDKVSVSEDEPKPDETVEIKVRVENNGDLDIEDIELNIRLVDENNNTVEDVDGDDLEDDAEFDLDSDDDYEETFSFNMPIDADDGDEYTVYIDACGDDENDAVECALDTSETIKINQEKHEVVIDSATLSPSSISCFNTVDASISLKDIGREDEDVAVSIKSDALELSRSQTVSLEAGDEDNYEKKINFAFAAPAGLTEGTYNIDIKAEYSGKIATKTLSLTKTACNVPSKTEEVVEDQNLVVVALDKNKIVTTTVGTQEDVLLAKPKTSSFKDSFEYMMLLIILGIVALGVIVFLIGMVIIKA